MKVKRVVSNIAASNLEEVREFYEVVFGLETVMDLGWIATLSSGDPMPVQISIASEGGSGTPVPELSIEVDDIDIALTRLKQRNIPVVYGPVQEPWGVRRFFIRDPAGTLINVLQH